MSKRKSQLEHAILDLEDQIAALELARNALIRHRPTAPHAKPKARPAKPPPAFGQHRPVPEDAAS